ncbi:MAG: hypothetical protein J1F38_01055 [Muribaculaceae bacterium]|nr:hypothetical protein [Muribaculaceae bacterium]
MKKIFYLIAGIGIAWGIVSCDNEPKNPGDYSVKSTLSIARFVNDNTGETYAIEVEEYIDSLFKQKVAVKDTTYDADGKQVVTTDSITVDRSHTTAFYKIKTIALPAEPSTYTIEIESNAKWFAPAAIRNGGANYFQNDGAVSGGGDGYLNYHTLDATTTTNRPNPFTLNIFTNDTTVYYRIPVTQLGGK